MISEALIDAFDGTVWGPEDPEYEAAVAAAVWNARKPLRRPALVAIAANETDVQRAVRYAAAHGLRIGIRSGGHSWIGTGVRDDALLLDLSRLDSIEIDAPARLASVGPAARGSVLNALLDEHGLVFPTGHCASVGMGGYLLGGGYGWNSRALGPACMSVLAIDVVLADGELVHATDETHPEIMWAARGAGPGFFGVVTRFTLRVHAGYEQVLLSTYLFPASMRDEVLAWSYDVLPATSPALELSAKVAYEPGRDEPTCRLVAVGFCGGGIGPEIFAPVENAPFLDRAVQRVERAPSSLAALYERSDLSMPEGNRFAVDGVWTGAPAADIVAAGRRIMETLPSRKSFLFWMLWGHYPEQPNACWSAQAPLYFSPNALWTDADDDLRHELWAHDALHDFDQIAVGTQFSDANPGDRPDAGMAAEQAARLEALRATYDPGGLFHGYLTPAESTTRLGRHLAAAG